MPSMPAGRPEKPPAAARRGGRACCACAHACGGDGAGCRAGNGCTLTGDMAKGWAAGLRKATARRPQLVRLRPCHCPLPPPTLTPAALLLPRPTLHVHVHSRVHPAAKACSSSSSKAAAAAAAHVHARGPCGHAHAHAGHAHAHAGRQRGAGGVIPPAPGASSPPSAQRQQGGVDVQVVGADHQVGRRLARRCGRLEQLVGAVGWSSRLVEGEVGRRLENGSRLGGVCSAAPRSPPAPHTRAP